jgi:peptidyl-prolyl cis-trans isomerase B (cyclophilin B)
MRFVQLAESGYYNGLTFDRIAPNAIIQGGRRIGDEARFPHPEVGTWPHVRGVLGLSMPDTNDAQFFVDLVDNPRFDHQYTVFAQILNGADVVDQLLEGDVIESITITP